MKKELKDYTDQELKDKFVSLDEMINKVECYGTSDLRLMSSIAKELEKRGIEPSYKTTFNN